MHISAAGIIMDESGTPVRDTDPPLSRSMIRMIGRELHVNDADARGGLGYVGKTSRAMGARRYA